MNKSTSWGKVANWYDNLLEKSEDSYQKKLILPNLIRLVEAKKGEIIVDLACGQGFFAREFAKLGTKVIGVDIAPELIDIAKQDKSVEYHVSAAENLNFIQNASIDKVIIVLSLQNIGNAQDVIKEVNRVLKTKGKLFLVLNHPTFRIPKRSSWGWDEATKTQYRRLDSYVSESKEEIQMHPGEKPWEKTISFHRPLQFYFKLMSKNGLMVSRLEEWTSHKISEPGPKKEAEDRARHEFPLFLFLEAVKQS
ncbi:MAG: class I SAM-dependent methyltransferase [bacterium]|nr:class I SAM-dependent methyltransferase [bacterium]